MQGQQQPTTTIAVDPQITTVYVCNRFTISIVIRNIPEETPMTGFGFIIGYDKTQMELISRRLNLPTDWKADAEELDTGIYMLKAGGPATIGDLAVVYITFHCISEGETPISFLETELLHAEGYIDHTPVKGAVNQVPRPPAPVGGELFSSNKVVVLSPFLALAAVAALTAAAVKKRKH
ncbi:MAG: cohesin domain-containing protein [Candidatus Bathyarchaeia archaeon]